MKNGTKPKPLSGEVQLLRERSRAARDQMLYWQKEMEHCNAQLRRLLGTGHYEGVTVYRVSGAHVTGFDRKGFTAVRVSRR